MKSREKFVLVAAITAMLVISLAAVNAGDAWEKHCQSNSKSKTSTWAAICSLQDQIDAAKEHTHTIYRVESTKTIPAAGVFSAAVDSHSVLCDQGDVLTGGGYKAEYMTTVNSYPADARNWTVLVVNSEPTIRNLTVYVLCLDTTP